MSVRGLEIYLRNDSASPIVMGTLSIPASSSAIIWDSINYTDGSTDNFEQVLTGIATFNEEIGDGYLVMVVNTVDQSPADAFAQFRELAVAFQEAAIKDRFSVLRLENEEVYGLKGIATALMPGLFDSDGYLKLSNLDDVAINAHLASTANPHGTSYTNINGDIEDASTVSSNPNLVLKPDGYGGVTWGVGGGDVTGPGTHSDDVLPVFEGVDTNILRTTGITINGSDEIDGVAQLDFAGATATTGDINLPDNGQIYSYGDGYERRLLKLTGGTLYIGSATTGSLTSVEFEADSTYIFRLGSTIVQMTPTEIDFQVNLNMNNNNIITGSGTVDGRDVSADGAALDAHLIDYDNPHQTSYSNLGGYIEDGYTESINTALVLKPDGYGGVLWGSATAGGGGDVIGPGTHGDNILPRFDGINTNVLQVSGITIDDSDNITGAGTYNGVNVEGHIGSTSNPHQTSFGNLDGYIEDSATATLDTSKVLKPDGTGGVVWGVDSVAGLDGYLPLDGSQAMTGDLDMGTNNIVNVVNPINPQDAATKAYVDGYIDANNEWSEVLANGSTTGGTSPQISNGDWIEFLDATHAIPASGDIRAGGSFEIVGRYSSVDNITLMNWNGGANTLYLGDLATGKINTLWSLVSPSGTHTWNVGSSTVLTLDANGLNAQAKLIQNVQDPVSAQDAATKAYVDGYIYDEISTLDHGSLLGLGDDDHTQYILVDGSRAFTNPVGGIDPTDAAHLATKSYVDGYIQSQNEWSEVLANGSTTGGTPPQISNGDWLEFLDATHSIPSSGDIRAAGSFNIEGRYSSVDNITILNWNGGANTLYFGDPATGKINQIYSMVAAGGTYTWDVGSANTVLTLDTNGLNAQAKLIQNVQDPVNPQDAATKNYVDGYFAGLEHHDLLGLGDDDHTQYILVDGTRDFTGTVGGVTPVDPDHLVTKQYVDGYFAGLEHHDLLGLGDDDHTQYILVDGSRDFTNPVGGVDPTDAAHLATKGYIDGYEGFILVDGTRAFTGPVEGVDPTDPAHLVTKSYVDGYIASNNEWSEVLANGNTTGGTNPEISSGDRIQAEDGSDLTLYTSSGGDFVLDSDTTSVSLTSPPGTSIGIFGPENPVGDGKGVSIYGGGASDGYNAASVNIIAGSCGGGGDTGNAGSVNLATGSGNATGNPGNITLLLWPAGTKDGYFFVKSNFVNQFSVSDGYISAHTNRIRHVQDPVEAQDAVTKNYVDGYFAGLEHGELLGLGDDDHTQYILVDGTRAFTGTVGGVTPTDAAHLATKGYVDGYINANNEWSEVLANGNTTDGYDPIISTGDTLRGETDLVLDSGSDRLLIQTSLLEFDDTLASVDIRQVSGSGVGATLTISSQSSTDNTGGDLVLDSGSGGGSSPPANDEGDVIISHGGVPTVRFTGTFDRNMVFYDYVQAQIKQDQITGNGTNFEIRAANATGNGSALVLYGGNSVTSGNGGGISFQAGNAATSGVGGTFIFDIGSGAGGSANGAFRITAPGVGSVFDVDENIIDAFTKRIQNVVNPVNPQDVATKNYVDGYTKTYVDGYVDNYLPLNGSRAMTGNLNMGTHYITGVVDPVNPQDAATKFYVDSQFASGGTTWSDVLGAGNTTDGYNPTISTGDTLYGETDLRLYSGDGTTGHTIYIRSGEGSSGASGAINITAGFPSTGNTGGGVYLGTNAPLSGAGNSGLISVSTGTASNGNSGVAQVTTGNAQDVSGKITIRTGTTSASSGGSGDVEVYGGNATGASGSGGAISLTAGDANASGGSGGGVILNAGDGYLVAGTITAFAGDCTVGTGGSVSLYAGDGAPGGSFSIYAGDGASGGDNGGNVIIETGSSSGAGVDGYIYLKRGGNEVARFDESGGERLLLKTPLIEFDESLASVTIRQAATSSAPANMTIEAQSRVNANGGDLILVGGGSSTLYNGGNVIIKSGEGGSGSPSQNDGNVEFWISSVKVAQFSGATLALDVQANPITNVEDPTNPQDAATKNYVDGYFFTYEPAITVRKNTGADVGTRPRLNFIEGANITLTIADDPGSDEIDITVATSGAVGEANTASNVGNATGEIYRDKVGVNFNFKTIDGYGGIGITNSADVVEIDGYALLPLDGSRSMTGDLDMGTNYITNVVDPVNPQDAATRAYVDGYTFQLPSHASTHENGGDDEIEISNLGTSETNTTYVLKPDGAGGVTWGPGGSSVDLDGYLPRDGSKPMTGDLDMDGYDILDAGEINGYRTYAASATNPSSPAPADGDRYFNTSLEMWMTYDGSRSKWLSEDSAYIQFGRDGFTAVGSYFRGIDGQTLSDTIGYHAFWNGTIVGAAITIESSVTSDIQFTEGGTTRATLSLTASVSERDTTLDGDFSQGGILAVRNASTGNTVDNCSGWFRVKWRA